MTKNCKPRAETRKLLYCEARHVERLGSHFNAGLWYDKFVDFEYQPGKPLDVNNASWITSLVASARGAWDSAVLREAIERQASLAHALGGIVLRLRNTSRFVTGLGRAHPVENGFAWHHTLGTPYLPGSGLKGALLGWARMTGNTNWQDRFGTAGQAGDLVFLDMLPVQPPRLCVEITTPHYNDYYQSPQNPPAPGDWSDPMPIPFLAVERAQNWQCAILPRPGTGPWDNAFRTQLRDFVVDALSWLGVGAKTAVGYGRFEVLEDDTRKLEVTLASAREKARQEADLRRAMANLSPLTAEFYRQRLEQAWDTDKNAFVQYAMYSDWLERLEAEPDAAALEMMRQLVEKHFPGLLSDPDRTEGKRNKPAFKEKQREFARRFNAIAS